MSVREIARLREAVARSVSAFPSGVCGLVAQFAATRPIAGNVVDAHFLLTRDRRGSNQLAFDEEKNLLFLVGPSLCVFAVGGSSLRLVRKSAYQHGMTESVFSVCV